MPTPEASEAARTIGALGNATRRANARDRRVREAVETLVSEAPPLTDEQRARLAALLGAK